MELYHVSNDLLSLGTIQLRNWQFREYYNLYIPVIESAIPNPTALQSILLTDRWISLRLNQSYMAITTLIEVVFEQTRREIAPEAPCRWDCSFFFLKPMDAYDYIKTHKKNGIVHKCRPLSEPLFISGMALVTPGIDITKPIEDELQVLYNRASEYWKPSNTILIPEVLVKGAVEILEALPPQQYY